LAKGAQGYGEEMIVPRYQQRTIYEGMYRSIIPDHKELLWEKWMVKIDTLLEDDELIEVVHEALGRRHPQSRIRGRKATPSEVVLRLMVLKHMKNWSYATLEREVRANLLYRDFTRIGGEKVPDEKTLVRLGQALGPEVIHEIHERIVQLAQEEKVVAGRKMRLDTTVVESNIHYPTDSSLLGDGVRVLTRTMKKIEQEVGQTGTKIRNWMRSVAHRLIELGKSGRGRGEDIKARQEKIYRRLMGVTRKVVTEAEVVVREVRRGIKKAADWKRQLVVEALAVQLKEVSVLTRRVLEQTKARVIKGDTHFKGKLLSIFEVETEAIRKGKAAKPTEFGKLVKIQEAENQIVTDYEVCRQRPADEKLLLPSIEKHREIFGRAPELVAGDAGFSNNENESGAKEAGVKKLAIPNKKTRSPARLAHQRQPWFRRAQRWRVGCEGRISVLKRRHGLFRSRYQGSSGMERWVGLGVIADNLINIARAIT
jgi:IS5 family transposase